MISSPLMDKEYDRLVPDYDMYRNRKVPGVETPPIPIPGVTESKPRRMKVGIPALSTIDAPVLETLSEERTPG